MIDSAILEVIIGMIFIFSLLSILVTQINSLISTFFRLRARHLRDGINELVQDPILRAKIFTHPLIRLVDDQMVLPAQVISDEDAEKIAQGKVNDLSWIPEQTFVSVLINLIQVSSDKELFGALLNVVDGMPSGPDRRKLRLALNKIVNTGEGVNELREIIDAIEEPIYRDALKQALDTIDDEIGQMGLEPNSVLSLMAGLRNVKNPYFRTALETILNTSQTLDDAHEKLGIWFEEGMTRATNNFTKHMQYFSLGIGLLIAVVINVDTINIARTLWEDPTIRTALNSVVDQTDIASLEATYQEAVDRINENIGEVSPEATPDPNVDTLADITADVEASTAEIGQTVDTLLDLRLPLGWTLTDLSELQGTANYDLLASDMNNFWNLTPANPNWLGNWLVKIIGWLATMIAIAQGAPFWFSLLRKVTGR